MGHPDRQIETADGSVIDKANVIISFWHSEECGEWINQTWSNFHQFLDYFEFHSLIMDVSPTPPIPCWRLLKVNFQTIPDNNLVETRPSPVERACSSHTHQDVRAEQWMASPAGLASWCIIRKPTWGYLLQEEPVGHLTLWREGLIAHGKWLPSDPSFNFA
jgi:hypothetical protein